MLHVLRKVLGSGAIATACLVAGQGFAAQDRLDGFDEYVETAMAAWQVPGLAIIVLDQGEIVYEKAFGVREVGQPEPVDLDTVFALSSTGKAYSATLAATVVDEGKLSWDDPVSEHLDYFQLPDPWVTRHVTFRDLLSHRVAGDLGIGKLELWAYTDLSREEVLSRMRYLEIGLVRFRGAFEYSNPSIMAAGLAAAVAGSGTWDALMQERILDGLGMTRATTTVESLWAQDDVDCLLHVRSRSPAPSQGRESRQYRDAAHRNRERTEGDPLAKGR